MDTKDIADLFITATGKIEFYWNFYTVTVLALIGWLVSSKRALNRQLKILITVGYLAFAGMNIIGLFGAYTFAEALRLDLLASSQKAQNPLSNAKEVLEVYSYDFQKYMLFLIHFVVGAFILFVIWKGNSSNDTSAKSQ